METPESTKINNEIFNSIEISSQENMIIKSLEKFYEDPININYFIPIINSESKISIRLIDYFITKYSKNNKINYKLNGDQVFNVHTSYKQQLKAFQKKHFDPFSRGDRIPYFMNESCIITTIGQLNFFRWFLSKKVYDYIKNNQNVIENDMNKKNKNNNKKNKKELCNSSNYQKISLQKVKKINISNMSNIGLSNSNYCYKSSSSSGLTCSESKSDKIVVSFSFN